MADHPPADDFPPELAELGKFKVLGKLGGGGMGTVWKARHTYLDRVVAVKVLNDAGAGTAEARDRFLQEMRAGGYLDHPNIAQTIDAAEAGSLLYLVMEYVEGVSLDQVVAQQGPLPVGFACRLVIQAAEGLRHAHLQDLVHRDVKPANLILSREGTVKILDFGLARLPRALQHMRKTRLNIFMGTADFVSPEQANDARGADIRSDIYSLGCTLYFLLAGKPPFAGSSTQEVALAHLTEQAMPISDLPPGLWDVIARMMAKRPNDRFHEVTEVIEALRPFARAVAPPRLPTPARRPWLPLLGAVIAGAALAAVVVGWMGHRPAPATKGPMVELLPMPLVEQPPSTQPTASPKLPPSAALPSPVSIPPVPRAVRFAQQPGTAGKWKLEEDTLIGEHLDRVGRCPDVYFGDKAWTDYDFSVEAKRLEGKMHCALWFRHVDPQNQYHYTFGHENRCVTLQHLHQRLWNNGDKYIKSAVGIPSPRPDRWYKLLVSVRGDQIRCFLDGKQMFNEKRTLFAKGCVGLHVNGATFAFRNIKVTSPDNKTLLEGVPDLGKRK